MGNVGSCLGGLVGGVDLLERADSMAEVEMALTLGGQIRRDGSQIQISADSGIEGTIGELYLECFLLSKTRIAPAPQGVPNLNRDILEQINVTGTIVCFLGNAVPADLKGFSAS